MSDASRHPSDERLAERLTALEMLVTHIERTLGDLDDTLLARGRQLDELERRLGQLTSEMGALRAGPSEVRKPEDEKPPHY